VPLTREEWVTRLDETLLPPLSRLVTRLAERYPHVNAKTFSVSVGAVTGFDGHGTGVECLLPATSPDQPDLVAISFQFGHLGDKPALVEADVSWGHPAGYCERSLIEDAVPLSDAILSRLADDLPELEEHLTAALDRRHPPI
jgi:hypothetical protein